MHTNLRISIYNISKQMQPTFQCSERTGGLQKYFHKKKKTLNSTAVSTAAALNFVTSKRKVKVPSWASEVAWGTSPVLTCYF